MLFYSHLGSTLEYIDTIYPYPYILSCKFSSHGILKHMQAYTSLVKTIHPVFPNIVPECIFFSGVNWPAN